MKDRLTRLRHLMEEDNLEAMLITQPENRRYLSGFTGSSGVLIITPDRALLATDFRYYEQVRLQAPDFELVQVTDSLALLLAETLKGLGAGRVGFESHDLTVETYQQWLEAMPEVDLVGRSGRVESLRQVKDEGELALIQEAVRIADQAMERLYGWIRPGMTEHQVAWELEADMRTHGAERLSFAMIVASGPNGAMAHAVTSDRAISAGEPVVIDMGCVVEGYCSDLTRSFCLHEASDEYLEVWNLVLRAQLAAEERIRAGMLGSEADAIAREIIYSAGYEGSFGHGLGHGVGLAIHEEPRASHSYHEPLPKGAVLTVEPGIYLPSWGGVRIEDMVVIGEGECRVLSACTKVPVVGA